MINNKTNFVDYILVLSFLLITASPFFLLISVIVPFTFMIIIWAYALSKRKLKNNKKIFLALIAVYLLILIQWALFGGFSPAGIYKPLLYFFTPYILYRLLGLKYFRCLFDIIYYSSIFTFLIYLLQSLFQTVNVLILKVMDFVFPYAWTDWPRSILFYSMPRESGFLLLRNSGIFHEPGAFSLYLMLAIIINTFNTRNTLDKKNIILAIILLTTFSTAGYILLILFLAYAIPKSKMHPSLKIIVFIVMIIATIKTYTSQEFLQKKIKENYSTQISAINKGEAGQGRFFAFFKAFEAFKQNIFFGKGILEANRPVGQKISSSGFGWGFMGFLANYGILFGFYYLFYYYKGLKKLCLFCGLPKILAILFFIIIQAGLSTQVFFFHTSFVMFFIIGLDSRMILETSIIPKRRLPYKTLLMYKNDSIVPRNRTEI
jgi:hypothetical protein